VQAAATAATAAVTQEIASASAPTLRLVLLELNGHTRNIFLFSRIGWANAVTSLLNM